MSASQGSSPTSAPTPETTAVVIGAGPAGLTAAFELATRSGIRPLVLEQSDHVGGISATIEHEGNRIDIGGHRFFSKSDRVMGWWLDRLPLQKSSDETLELAYQGRRTDLDTPLTGPDPNEVDEVMLVRRRRSRIYWHGELFDYPLSLTFRTVRKLGFIRAVRAIASYLHAVLRPVKPERTLEDFLINRFGRELYLTFFRSYTEKVWGVPCEDISAEWGAQRIKGLSIRRAIAHAVGSARRSPENGDIDQQGTETSLIERFLYPKFGPGQMWQTVAGEVEEAGGEIRLGQRVVDLEVDGSRLVAVIAEDVTTGERTRHQADHVFSTMPITELIHALEPDPPLNVRTVASRLPYRDFFTVGLLVDRLELGENGLIEDNWIYIQDPDVQLGRLQIFNNWSPWMAADPRKVWLGLEYFCYDHDPIWERDDDELIALGAEELAHIGVIRPGVVLDGCVHRQPKAYPAYFGSYSRFDEIRTFLDGYDNLWCLGRNGQHRYNNQDHSMLTAMTAVDEILAGTNDRSRVWAVNTEQEYIEER